MARLSRRFSRYFSLSRRSTEVPPSTPTSTSPRIDKARISKPILSERETQTLLSSQPASHTHTHSASQYTISDADLRALEEEKLSRRLQDAIDDILASYQGTSTTPPLPPPKDNRDMVSPPSTAPTNPFADPCSPRPIATATSSSPTPSSSSVYSSPPPSPPTINARLERFRDTPPPAPGWEKVSFGRQTRLFGPEGFVDFDGGGEGRGEGRMMGIGVDMGRGRKDWRGEFGRRGYAML
ncbi:hypothetical protein SVAN01_02737 [Stagonosporopsis vannaccii]|nr:hypothetical protein SVAN01_02737 [Stagonosporopsis vannaccii]